MGGGKGTQTSDTEVRMPAYLEEEHKAFLSLMADYREKLLSDQDYDGEIDSSPYRDYTDKDYEDAFLGAGYVMSSYPSLYDMYGKFLAGLDVEVLFDEVFEDTINGTVISNVISAEADILEDDLVENVLPRFETGMRDINSVISSSFVIGRAMIETGRTKAISRFSADIRGRALPLVTERWKAHLEWNRSVVEMYAQIMKFFILTDMDTDTHNMEIHAKHSLWPFTILEYNRVALGALTGAYSSHTEVAGGSKAQKMLGGAMTGMSAGAMIGSVVPGIGTLIGAAVGGVVGLAGGMA